MTFVASLTVLIMVVNFHVIASAKTSKQSIAVLEKLFNNANGPSWNFISMNTCIRALDGASLVGNPWSFAKNGNGEYLIDPCLEDTPGLKNFAGIGCKCPTDITANCEITKIALPCGQLEGEMVNELTSLRGLGRIDLGQNSLFGSIPESLNLLTNLQSLSLSKNQLIGPIPDLEPLSKLQVLNLGENSLTGPLPLSLRNLTSLRYLLLDKNRLSGSIPADMKLMRRLQGLFLNENSLTGPVPAALSACTKLEYLSLNSNSLTGSIPADLGSLTNLAELNLYFNSLHGTIPAELDRHKNIRHIDFSGNSLHGTIPPTFRTLIKLTSLLVQGNLLESSTGVNGTFNFIDVQSQLELAHVDIANNLFSGTLPGVVFKLPALQAFMAGTNCFKGTLPDNICQATRLKALHLSYLSSAPNCPQHSSIWSGTVFEDKPLRWNGFITREPIMGLMPYCCFDMPHMQSLHISGNQLYGVLPVAISPSIRVLELSRNKLSGTISELLTKSDNLTAMDISYNRISGDFAAFDTDADDQDFFARKGFVPVLHDNYLSGSIPKSLWKLGQVIVLDVLEGNTIACEDAQTLSIINGPKVNSNLLCGSMSMNIMLYSFTALALLVLLLMWYVKDSTRMMNTKAELLLWLDVAQGRKDVNNVGNFSPLHIMRYSQWITMYRKFAIYSAYLFVVLLVMYVGLSGGQYVSVTHKYSWNATAAFLTGNGSCLWVLIAGLMFMCMIWYVIFYYEHSDECREVWGGGEEKEEEEKNDGEDVSDRNTKHMHKSGLPVGGRDRAPSIETIAQYQQEIGSWKIGEKEKMRLKDKLSPTWKKSLSRSLAPLLRLVLMCSSIWFTTLFGNIYYLTKHIKEPATATNRDVQLLFAFLLFFMYMVATPRIFHSRSLYFCVKGKFHNEFNRKIFGSKISMAVIVNAITCVVIPYVTALCMLPQCLGNAFVASPSTMSKYPVIYCDLKYRSGECVVSGNYDQTSVDAIPFNYSYTCSNSIIQLYTPFYQQVFLLLIARSILYLAYLTWDAYVNNEKDILTTSKMDQQATAFDCQRNWCMWNNAMRHLRNCFIWSMPTYHLMYSNQQRHTAGTHFFHKNTKDWVTKTVPSQLTSMLIVLCAGFLAPPLALMGTASVIMDSYVCHIILGRFLVNCYTVSQAVNPTGFTAAEDASAFQKDTSLPLTLNSQAEGAMKKNAVCRPPMKNTTSYVKLTITKVRRARMRVAIEECAQPWGAIAALRAVEVQCKFVPPCALVAARVVYILIPGVMMALLLLDIRNSTGKTREHSRSAANAIISLAFSLQIVPWAAKKIYRWRNQVVDDAVGEGVEMQEMASSPAGAGAGASHCDKVDDIPRESESGEEDHTVNTNSVSSSKSTFVMNPMAEGSV